MAAPSRRAAGAAALAVCLVAAIAILAAYGLAKGSVEIPLPELLRALTGRGGDEPSAMIILEFRLPRIVMAVLVGMMLASGGTIAQAAFRNPLADPYIVGISAGAVAGATLAFFLKLPDAYFGIFAFATALAAAFLIFSLAGLRGKADTSTLLIVGIAVSSFLGAGTSFAMYAAGEDSFRVLVWTMGYLGGASWGKIGLLAVPLAVALAYFMYLRNDLDALAMGDEEAWSLGVDSGRLKRRLLAAVSLITAFSVAFSGMIGFVGLIVPHAVRMVAGGNHGRLVPLAALAGGAFLLFADTLARTLLAPTEIPIGVVTALFGAPFFLYLAVRAQKGSAR